MPVFFFRPIAVFLVRANFASLFLFIECEETRALGSDTLERSLTEFYRHVVVGTLVHERVDRFAKADVDRRSSSVVTVRR